MKKIKVLRCPHPGCGVFFATKAEYYEHLDLGRHCSICGFSLAIPEEKSMALKSLVYCPACKLMKSTTFPKRKERIV